MTTRNFYYKLRGISGIYIITDLLTGLSYIGASANIGRRWAEHLTHNKLPIQKAIQEKGLENFDFRVLERTKNLAEREKYWIEQLDTYNNGYNIDKGGAGSLTEEARKRMSKSRKGRKCPWNKGKKHVPPSEETRRKISESGKGKKHKSFSEETKKKMSNSKKGSIIIYNPYLKMSKRIKEEYLPEYLSNNWVRGMPRKSKR